MLLILLGKLHMSSTDSFRGCSKLPVPSSLPYCSVPSLSCRAAVAATCHLCFLAQLPMCLHELGTCDLRISGISISPLICPLFYFMKLRNLREKKKELEGDKPPEICNEESALINASARKCCLLEHSAKDRTRGNASTYPLIQIASSFVKHPLPGARELSTVILIGPLLLLETFFRN